MFTRDSQKIRYYLGNTLCRLINPGEGYLQKLHERILYIICKFLKDSDSKFLFIQLPIEELTNAEQDQSELYSCLASTLALGLRLFLKEPEIPTQLNYPGDWYHEGDCFLLNSGGNLYFLSVTKREKT